MKKYPILQIGLSLQMHRRTVRLYMKSDDLPERRKSLRKNGLGKYLPFLEQRWAEGDRNNTKLGRELKEKGYPDMVSTVVHYLTAWREVCPDRKETAEMVKAKLRRFATPSPKRTYCLIFKPRPNDESWADKYIKQLFKDAPDLKEAVKLGQEFSRLMKNRESEELVNWLAKAEESKIHELVGFANGIRQDFKAVKMAFASEYSNGQTEG